MKRRTFYIIVAFLALLVGIVSTQVIGGFNMLKREVTKTVTQLTQPRFRYVYGVPSDKYAIYSFHSSDAEKIYADDCIGCNEEVGNINVYHEFTSPEQTRYLFQSNSEGDEVIEQSSKLNENGQKIGERAINIVRQDGKVISARIFWTEGDDFWFVQAPTLELAREFESSDTFRLLKSNKY